MPTLFSFYKNHIHWLVAAIFFVLTLLLGYGVEQHEFYKIIALYVPFFALYLMVYKWLDKPLRFWLITAILLRLLLVFALPNLSNDIYRFIWDGRLLVQGYNPFDHLPFYYLENNIPVKGIDRALFEAFGSKNFFTVYPPVAQAQFASACWLFPTSIYGSSVVMKLWLFLFEVGSILLMVKLLARLGLPAKNVLLYALNPLIIFEITGNLHFEGAMVFFFLLAVWLLIELAQLSIINYQSSIVYALSICSKLLTILFLPFFIKRLGWGRSAVYFALIGIFTVVFFVPIVNATFIENFGNSLNLYFQKLEYNASLYYAFRWLFYQFSGYNQIAILGPGLGVLAMVGILAMAYFEKIPEDKMGSYRQLMETCLFAICLYLACTTTLHPWYLALPIALSVFTNWRFPVVWSGLIFLTYVNYSYEPFRENLWVVFLEYASVTGYLFFEWEKKDKPTYQAEE